MLSTVFCNFLQQRLFNYKLLSERKVYQWQCDYGFAPLKSRERFGPSFNSAVAKVLPEVGFRNGLVYTAQPGLAAKGVPRSCNQLQKITKNSLNFFWNIFLTV